MTTAIDIYPPCPQPTWVKVGAKVEVIGEGRGTPFRITAVEPGRAAVVHANDYYKGHSGGCWESITKIYRPGHFDADYAETHQQLTLFGSEPKVGSKSAKAKPAKSPPKYTYTLMTVADARAKDWVYVPNCLVEDIVQIWRYLTKRRPDFPEFSDNGELVSSVAEVDWQRTKVFSSTYRDYLCIARSKVG